MTTATTHAETTVARLAALYDQWLQEGAPPLGTTINRWVDRRLGQFHQALQPPAALPEPGHLEVTRKIGHGLVVNEAPPRISLALAFLPELCSSWGLNIEGGDKLNVAEQVLYQVVGYDPHAQALLLDLVEDWRYTPPAVPS
ncbi:hypothetical protein [Streptomyces sp. NPDC047070]|uniref:hypothetical protein n=1 Tax=Streptomyces sp. NPDC047070 TaxID=3154923 RepID=UPI0034538043